MVEDAGHPGGAKQLSGVGGSATGSDHGEVGGVGGLQGSIQNEILIDKQVADTLAVGELEGLVDAGTAQVSIEEDDITPALSHDHRQVDRYKGLAIRRGGAGHQDGAEGGIDAGELDVRAQGAEGFGNQRAGFLGGDRLAAINLVAGNQAQDRKVQLLLDLVGTPDRVVQRLLEEDHAQSEEHAYHPSEDGIHEGARADGEFRRDGGFSLDHRSG